MRLTVIVAALLAAGVHGQALGPKTVESRDALTAAGADLISSLLAGFSLCPPFNKSTFNINAFQLYPENADWDGYLCQVYFGYVHRLMIITIFTRSYIIRL
jgi:hypothetical protein